VPAVNDAEDNSAAIDATAGGWLFGWEAFDIPLLILLPVLLVLSGFFSGSETALFSMSETERMHLRRRGTLAGRAVQTLLADPRMLLITILLGNMAVNVLFFVISSVLMMRADAGVIGSIAMAVLTVLAIVLFGEILPKMLANNRRTTFASIVAPLLLTLHGTILPLRVVLDRAVVAPLSRLTAPTAAPPQLDEEELTALLEISSRQGVIDADEQRLLRDVFNMGRLRVRDVMTPRVRMKAIPLHGQRDEVIELVRETRLHRLPVYRRNMDDIVGILPVKPYLLASHKRKVRIKRLLEKPRFVPHVATLEQLLEQFRKTHTQSAIVVDEYGGTAGIVSLEDVVERLVGDIVSGSPDETRPPEQLDRRRWRVDGNMSVHDWAEAFGQPLATTRVSTVGGLIMEHLGRAPHVGDEITIGNIKLNVEAIDRSRVETAILTLLQ
jgi:putative hemolysin